VLAVAAVADPPPVVPQYAAATPATSNVTAVSRSASGRSLRLELVDDTMFIASAPEP
jgi:hypothetical protein